MHKGLRTAGDGCIVLEPIEKDKEWRYGQREQGGHPTITFEHMQQCFTGPCSRRLRVCAVAGNMAQHTTCQMQGQPEGHHHMADAAGVLRSNFGKTTRGIDFMGSL